MPERQWLRWGADQDWQSNIVSYKTYDLAVGAGSFLNQLLSNGAPAELEPAFHLEETDNRLRSEVLTALREGQGAFRLRVLDAYERRCAVTGEHSLPVLDAAHIQPYLGPASNHIQNGISLRADIHRLFDTGYVTVTPDLRFQVSRHLKEDYDNGREYYGLDGRPLLVVPHRVDVRPSMKALEWHVNNVYRG